MLTHPQDKWAQWLLQRRDGNHPTLRQAMLPDLEAFREQVLTHAHLKAGDVLLDVGTGTGLIAFGALELVGEQGQVLFSDISQDVLDHCQALAAERGVLDHCQFVCASADQLAPVADALGRFRELLVKEQEGGIECRYGTTLHRTRISADARPAQ
jgi:arsenite methyltransferase